MDDTLQEDDIVVLADDASDSPREYRVLSVGERTNYGYGPQLVDIEALDDSYGHSRMSITSADLTKVG